MLLHVRANGNSPAESVVPGVGGNEPSPIDKRSHKDAGKRQRVTPDPLCNKLAKGNRKAQERMKQIEKERGCSEQTATKTNSYIMTRGCIRDGTRTR